MKPSAHGTKEHLNSLGARPEEQDAHPKEQPIEVAARVISYPEVAPALETGPMNKMGGTRDSSGCSTRGCEISGTG